MTESQHDQHDQHDHQGRLPVTTGRRATAAVWESLRGQRLLLIVASVISAGAAALELVTPALLGTIVDDISAGGETRPVWLYGTLIAVSMIAAAALGVLGVLIASRVLERLLASLRERLVSTALAMPQQRVERSGTGDLISRASDDVAQVSEALSQVLPTLSRTLFTIVLTLAALFALDWRFGLTFVVGVPLYWWSLRWYIRLAPPLYAAERAAFGTRAHHLLSALKGLDTVLAFRLSWWHGARVALSSWAVATWALRARTVQTMFNWRIDLSFLVVVTVVLFAGFGLVDADLVTIGAATTAVLYLLRLQGPLRGLMLQIDTLQAAAASLTRIIGVTDLARPAATAPDSPDAPGTPCTPCTPVRLNGVSFSYQDGPAVLHDISLAIPAGQRVAVVGASGAGKTTLAALAAGIHAPSRGTVSAPSDTMLVSQETHIFTGSLRDNLTLGAPRHRRRQSRRRAHRDRCRRSARGTPPRPGHPTGGERPFPVRGPGAASGADQTPDRRPRPRDPGRGHRRGRIGARRSAGPGSQRRPAGTHRHRHRPPPVAGGCLRQDPRHGARARPGGRFPR